MSQDNPKQGKSHKLKSSYNIIIITEQFNKKKLTMTESGVTE